MCSTPTISLSIRSGVLQTQKLRTRPQKSAAWLICKSRKHQRCTPLLKKTAPLATNWTRNQIQKARLKCYKIVMVLALKQNFDCETSADYGYCCMLSACVVDADRVGWWFFFSILFFVQFCVKCQWIGIHVLFLDINSCSCQMCMHECCAWSKMSFVFVSV